MPLVAGETSSAATFAASPMGGSAVVATRVGFALPVIGLVFRRVDAASSRLLRNASCVCFSSTRPRVASLPARIGVGGPESPGRTT